jgi:ABC-type tungstate transport system permease subunit
MTHRGVGASFASRADRPAPTRASVAWKAAGRTPAPAWHSSRPDKAWPHLASPERRSAHRPIDVREIESTVRLAVLCENEPPLINTHAVMYKTRLPADRLESVQQFVSWLTDGAGRDAIGRYQIKGQPAFTIWPAGARRGHPDDLPDVRFDIMGGDDSRLR